VKESKKRRRKQPGKLMAKSHSQPVNLPGARPLMNPLQLFIFIGLGKGNQKVHFSNIFSTSVVVPHFINGPFEVPEQLSVKQTLERNRNLKGFKNC